MCRLMDSALQGLAWEVCMPYMDDVAVWSTGVGADFDRRESASFDQHLYRLGLVLERLRWAGLSAKASKCVLFATKAPYLGHVISRSGLEMDPAKVEKIKNVDPHAINSVTIVRSFLGLCSYYRRFVPGFAKITAPLHDLTKDGVDVATESQAEPAQSAIRQLVEVMTTEPVVLLMPRFDRPFIVKTDAAATEGIGGLLVQHDDDGRERVVCYYGRRLTKAEQNWTVTEIELLAALECIRTWRPYLWGRHFTLIVDHAALKWLHTMKDTVEGGSASRLMRWILKLQEYDFEVVHKPGKEHSDADGVSRIVNAFVPEPGPADTSTAPSTDVAQVAAVTSPSGRGRGARGRGERGRGARGRGTRRRVATDRSLLQAQREERQAGKTSRTVTEFHLSAPTPADDELRKAQREDPHCRLLYQFLSEGLPSGSTPPADDETEPVPFRLPPSGGLPSADDEPEPVPFRLLQWAKRECRHLRLLPDGLIYRIDPVVQPSNSPQDLRRARHYRRRGLEPPPTRSHDRPVPEPTYCLFVPEDYRPALLEAFHDHLGHPGGRRCVDLIRRRYYWPGMKADVFDHIRKCHDCQMAKRLRVGLAAPTRSGVGAYPFDAVVCDICDMTPMHDGSYDKILVFADSLSRWVEVVPFKGAPTGEAVLDAFAAHVACRYGWPREIRSDRGTNLANLLSDEIYKLTGVRRLRGGKYHAPSQGIVERVQQTLVEMSRATDEGGAHWADHLPFLLFSYRATPHRVTGLSPAMLLYGRELRAPFQLGEASGVHPSAVLDSEEPASVYALRLHRRLQAAWKAAREATAYEQEISTSNSFMHSDASRTPEFAPGDRVCYRTYNHNNKLYTSWFGPCRVEANLGRGNYRLRDLANNILDNNFHISQLRPYHSGETLAADEFVVDRLLDRRPNHGPPSRFQYLVKWRQCPLTDATWEPRKELMRRCADLVDRYDVQFPLQPAQRRQTTAPRATAPTPPDPSLMQPTPPMAAPDDDREAPREARLRQGLWLYAFSTPRGGLRWLPEQLLGDTSAPAFARLRSEYRRKLQPATASAIEVDQLFRRGGLDSDAASANLANHRVKRRSPPKPRLRIFKRLTGSDPTGEQNL